MSIKVRMLLKEIAVAEGGGKIPGGGLPYFPFAFALQKTQTAHFSHPYLWWLVLL